MFIDKREGTKENDKIFFDKDDFPQRKIYFKMQKWGSYLILPLHDNPKGKLKMSRQEAIDIILKKQDESGRMFSRMKT